MKIRTLTIALTLAALTIAAGAQNRDPGPSPAPRPQPTPRPVDLGRLEGRTYTNDQFGLSLTIPEGWTVNVIPTEALRRGAKETVTEESSAAVKQGMDEAIDRTTALLTASKYPPGSPDPFNATLLLAAERIPTAVVKTPADYRDTMIASLNRMQGVEVREAEPARRRRIGAHDFLLVALRITVPRGFTMQKQLVTVRGPYALVLAFNYVDEDDAQVFEDVVRSVKAK
jgi:hypothetical protein